MAEILSHYLGVGLPSEKEAFAVRLGHLLCQVIVEVGFREELVFRKLVQWVQLFWNLVLGPLSLRNNRVGRFIPNGARLRKLRVIISFLPGSVPVRQRSIARAAVVNRIFVRLARLGRHDGYIIEG